MAQTELLARDFNFEINTGTTLVPVWTPILGINTWEWNESPKDVDASDFDDGGYGASLIVAATVSCMLKGNAQADAGVPDPGQSAVRTAARAFGGAGIKEFQIWSKSAASFADAADDGGSIAFKAVAKNGKTGGGNEALLPFEVELLVRGQPTYAGFFA